MIGHLGDRDGVLIADETGFIKKGTRSAGVQRQYSGTAGRTENCQVGVFLAYASVHGHALIDRELYLPASWTDDRDRCRQAGIPADTEFISKPRQAQAMTGRAIEARVPFAWFTADEAYGQAKWLQAWLEEHGVSYVMAIRRSDTLTTGAGEQRADALIDALSPQCWQRISAGAGAHGPREYHWARIPVRSGWERGRGHWLLARRSLRDPGEIAYYACYGPRRTSTAGLAAVAGSRWHVGMLPDRQNRNRPRSVPGPPLRRLVPAHHAGHAGAHLPVRHRGDRPKSPGSGLIPVTLGEARRLLAHMITPTAGRCAPWAWSRWRRRHQHRAKTSHYQRRRANHHEVLLEY